MLYEAENALGKYEPLGRFLKASTKEEETLTYKQIEAILHDTLPESAYQLSAWWANENTHVQAEAWREAGWKVAKVELGQTITWHRAG
ncbi:MAG: hypothetical protein ACM3ZC_09765 [Bacteroidota bacterium]